MTARRVPPSVPYFFLSHAHTAPLADAERAGPDHWVSRFFTDISAAVREIAGLPGKTEVGFFDGVLPAGSDWKARITESLGGAQTFVPLLSPAYFAMSWPGREWTCFGTRLAALPPRDRARHLLPVLWSPLSRSQEPPEGTDPFRFGSDIPEYAENGLRALSMLSMYRPAYRTIVNRVAAEIVGVSRDFGLTASAVPALDEVASAFRDKHTYDHFAVTVVAPTAMTAPAGRDDRRYGSDSVEWRPFGEREALPLAEYAVTVAERLDFSTAVRSLDEAAASDTTQPGVVLIDPWIALAPGYTETLSRLRSLFSGDRGWWTLPLMILDAADTESAARRTELTGRISRILEDAGALSTMAAQRGADGVTSIEEFAVVLPVLVAEAERQYLRHSPHFPPDIDAPTRPTLRGMPPPPGVNNRRTNDR